MSDINSSQEGAQETGLLGGISSVARNFLGLVINRIELASLEISEVRGNAVKLLLLLVFGCIATAFALLWGAALIVALTWESMGWTILAVLAGAFAIAAVLFFIYARKLIANGGLSMRATMEELKADRDALL